MIAPPYEPAPDEERVAEAYTRILDAIRRGRGPRGAFRPYLYVTISNLVNRITQALERSVDHGADPPLTSPAGIPPAPAS